VGAPEVATAGEQAKSMAAASKGRRSK